MGFARTGDGHKITGGVKIKPKSRIPGPPTSHFSMKGCDGRPLRMACATITGLFSSMAVPLIFPSRPCMRGRSPITERIQVGLSCWYGGGDGGGDLLILHIIWGRVPGRSEREVYVRVKKRTGRGDGRANGGERGGKEELDKRSLLSSHHRSATLVRGLLRRRGRRRLLLAFALGLLRLLDLYERVRESRFTT